MNRIINLAFMAVLVFGGLQLAVAQQSIAVVTDTTRTSPTSASEKSSNEAKAPVKPQVSECRFCRWFEVQTATISARYKFAADSKGVTLANQAGYSDVFKGRLKFDKEAKYSLSLGVFTGPSFISHWNATSVGTGDLVTNHYLKQLYFSAKPAAGVELQYGGLYFTRGESTEITSYSNSGYLVGQRVSVKRPKQIFFDEVDVTYAYLGDTAKPSLFKRLHRLNESNYHQFLISKNVGKRAVVSADYTFLAGAETMREAVKLNLKEVRAVDSLRFETYQRMDVHAAHGYAISADKLLLDKRLALNGGYASIDRYYGGLNADRFNKGNRIFLNSTFTLNKEFSFSVYAGHAVATSFPITNRNRVDLIFNYNLLSTLQKLNLL